MHLFIIHWRDTEIIPDELKTGKVTGMDFGDFNWVGEFSVTKKGTKVWDNVIDGEIRW